MNFWLEFFGTVFGFLMVLCSIYQKRITWIFNFISSFVYIFVFFYNKLYANMTIFIYYVIISIFAWIHWREDDNTLEVTYSSNTERFISTIVFLILFFLIGFYLKYFTDSEAAFYDSLISSLSIIATWFNTTKKMESWFVWILVNVSATFIYFFQGLYLTSVLYFVFIIMSVQGYYAWKNGKNLKSF